MAKKSIDEMIKSMSIREKARQLTQINAAFLKKDSKAQITGMDESLGVGAADINETSSVLNFMYGGEMAEVQKDYLEKSDKKIPLVFMQDVIHGYRTIFPIPLAMGATFDAQLTEDCMEMSAKEAKANGVQVTFAPMVDLVRDSRWGRVMESPGEDPYLNGEMGKAMIRGFRKGGLATCVKHFAVYGAPEAGRDYNTVEIGEHALHEFYLRAYHECLKENPEMVMSSFNMLNGIPVNGNKELLIDLLRKEWGFDGVLISDYNAIREMIKHGYLENEKECARVAANHEIDMEMMSATYIQYLEELVAEGKVSEETIDRMLKRVLTLKEKLGLLDDPYVGVDFEAAKKMELSKEHRELARVAAEKSMVLLKNEGVLPLKADTKVVLAGPFAEEQNIIGEWKCFGKPEETVSVKMGMEAFLGKHVVAVKGCDMDLLATDLSGIPAAVEAAKDAEVIVACVGEPAKDSGEGASRSDINIPKAQTALIKALSELGKPIVLVVFGGRPQVLTEVEPLVDAILYAWMPGSEGGNAVANILYGEVCPSAKTTITFPRATGQCPIFYNHFTTGRPKKVDDIPHSYYNSSYRDVINAPLYPFGYGLSYTTFEISDLQLSTTALKSGETMKASVLVKNTGNYDGEEVVQLYIRDYFASMVRPVKELKGYQKVFLKAGEEMRVEFDVTEETLKFFDCNRNFVAEEGAFALMLGNSSENVLSQDFTFNK